MTNLKTHFQLHFEPETYVLYEECNGKYYRKKWAEIANCKAIKRIHYNTSKWKHYLIIDIDNENIYKYRKNNLPEPNFILKNRTKGGGHLFYVLNKGVYFKNEYYLNMWKILQKSFTELAGGDKLNKGYVGKFINSLHFEYEELNPYAYNIHYLYNKINHTPTNNQAYSPVYVDSNTYKYIKLSNKKLKVVNKSLNLIQVGERNNTLFEKTRKYAYIQVIKLPESKFKIAVKNYINKLNNNLLIPLPKSEIKATANSIIKYCIKNKTKIKNYNNNNKNSKNRGIMGLQKEQEIKEKQKLGAKYTAEIKAKKTIFKLRLSVIEMKARGLKITNQSLAEYSKISLASVKRYKSKLSFI